DIRDPREPAPSMTPPQAGPPAKETAPVPEPSVSGISEREMPASDAAESATAQSQEPASTVIPLMTELPFTIQAQLPEMKFSGHAYSPAPELRLIMINNAVAREGELIEPDLYLEEITENGLIMSYRGTWFRIELF
ncbi:MAG: general secretion pathway protein GspB, partial [Desulfocapsaceae bacterium]